MQVLKEELEWWKIKAERAEKSILKNKLLFATAGEKGKAETEKTESWSHGMDRFLLALCKQHTTVLTKRKSYEEKLKRVYDDINR